MAQNGETIRVSDTPRTDAVMQSAHGKIESARACDLEDLARSLEAELVALQKTSAMLADNWTNTERLLARKAAPPSARCCGKPRQT